MYLVRPIFLLFQMYLGADRTSSHNRVCLPERHESYTLLQVPKGSQRGGQLSLSTHIPRCHSL